MFEKEETIRTVYDEFGGYLTKVSIDELNQIQEFYRQFFMNQGVTFTYTITKKVWNEFSPSISFQELSPSKGGKLSKVLAFNE